MVLDEKRLTVQQISKSIVSSSGSVETFNWDLEDEQTAFKMDHYNAKVRVQVEKS